MDRDQFDEMLENAGRLLDDAKFEEALACLDQIPQPLSDAEDRVEWGTMRAWALAELHRIDEALDLADTLLEEFPEHARVHCAMGFALSQADCLADALDALEHAYELDPSDELVLINLAHVYERVRDYERAVKIYDEAIEAGVRVDWVLVRKAAALADADRLPEAIATLRRYLSLMPDDAEQWSELAMLLAEHGDADAAVDGFSQAAELAPDDAETRMNWGLTLVRAGQLDAAREQMAHIVRIEGRQARAQLLEAAILEQEGHVRLAEQCYERLLAELDPSREFDLVFTLERAMDFFSRQKNRKRCEELLRRAYVENACTVELCEAYREIETRFARKAYWLSLVLEADYRRGLREAYTRGKDRQRSRGRYLRNFQVVARDRDDAVAMVLDFAARMGEKRARIREIVREEAIDDAYTGLYEIERDSVVLARDELA